MLRKVLLASIMVVSVLIIMFGLQKFNEKQTRRQRSARPDNETLAAPPVSGIDVRLYDKVTNDLVAIITGVQASQLSDKGPVDILKPVITILKDKNNYTVIRGDTGQIAGRDQQGMQEGWLRGNVVAVITNRERADNTVLKCDELRFRGKEGQVFIPGPMTIHNSLLDVAGVGLTADRNMNGSRIDSGVRVTVRQAGALGKISGEQGKPADPSKTQSIVVTCDGVMTYSQNPNRATFEKGVRASQGDDILSADSMVVEFDKLPSADNSSGSGAMTIHRAVMTSERPDGVVVEGPSRKGVGQRFEFDGREGVIAYFGNPCRTSQKSGSQTFELEGDEVRIGPKRLLSQAETLPAGIGENSQKVLVVGKPARIESVPAEAGASGVLLTGNRILFDQEAHVAWVEGSPDRHAVVGQGKNRVEGVEMLLTQKTETRGEKVWAKGPGKLDVVRNDSAGADGGAGAGKKETTSTVDFGGEMNYLPDEEQANFTGGVTLVDGATKVVGRTVSVEFAEGNSAGESRSLRKMTAVGDVVVSGDKLNAIAEKLDYGFPNPGDKLFTAKLEARPGGVCQVTSGDILSRAERIDMEQKPAGEGKTSLLATGRGKGYVLFKTAAAADATTSAPTVEVRYDKTGVFDDSRQKAVFDGNVSVKRADMDLTAQHVEMNMVRRKGDPGNPNAQSGMDLTGLDAQDNVTLVSGAPGSQTTGTGRTLVWDRLKGTTRLAGDERKPARLVQDKTQIDAPVMVGKLNDKNQIESVTTSGGGHMIGYTHSLQNSSTTAKAAPADNGLAPLKLSKMDVTWTGDGLYQVLEAQDPAVEPTAAVQVKDNVHAVSEDSDVTSNILVVYTGPVPKKADAPPAAAGTIKLEVRNIFALGNARARTFVTLGGYYRYARGDSLEWDRLRNRMVVTSEKGDAVVWDNSNEWIGDRLVVNRTAEGKLETESTSGRKIIFYEEGTPKIPADDAKDWKPIY